MTEESFKEWKNQTRQGAMEKEVQRLRATSQMQSRKIGGLRRTLYFQYFFFIVLFSVLLFKGLIILPGINNQYNTPATPDPVFINKTSEALSPDTTPESIQIDTTSLEEIKNTKGILFCIQIGAYTGIDLGKYKRNLVSIQQDSYEGINQFTLGRFTDYNEAVDFLKIVQQMGFKDAFIMSFKDGRRIQIQEVIPGRSSSSTRTSQPAPTAVATDSPTMTEE
jgi:hypothetical protein